MSKTSPRWFRIVLSIVLISLTIGVGLGVPALADGMTGDPPAERPTGTSIDTVTTTETLDIVDVALYLLLVI